MAEELKAIPRGLRRKSRIKAVEIFATNPTMSDDKVATAVGVTRGTIVNWRKDLDFIDACYDRFMEISGTYMPQVIMAMIREAMEGNVRAAELILKHYGKFEDKVTIRIESPFMQHLRKADVGDILEAEIVEESREVYREEFAKLPERVPHLTEGSEHIKEVLRVNKQVKTIISESEKKRRRNKMEGVRRRAKKVGFSPMDRGRQTKTARARYLKKLEAIERVKGIKPRTP